MKKSKVMIKCMQNVKLSYQDNCLTWITGWFILPHSWIILLEELYSQKVCINIFSWIQANVQTIRDHSILNNMLKVWYKYYWDLIWNSKLSINLTYSHSNLSSCTFPFFRSHLFFKKKNPCSDNLISLLLLEKKCFAYDSLMYLQSKPVPFLLVI